MSAHHCSVINHSLHIKSPLCVALLAKPGGQNTGVGRYVHMLQGGLQEAGINAVRLAPTVPPLPRTGYVLLQHLGVDLHTFLLNFPVWAQYAPTDAYHLTSQNLASLLLFRRPKGRVVVTVHDIIPYMLRDDPQLCSYRTGADRFFDRLAMAGLKRADLLIADSQYTKQCLIDYLGIAPYMIHVVYLGIDSERFKPLPVPEVIRERYGLPRGRRYLIYVGSEDRRKNLVTLVRALAQVRRALPDVELIKVGRPHFVGERQRLLDLANQLGLQTAIHFLDDVPEGDLPLLYNLADVCLMPSLYEGFGFPVLEAMACSTPVICVRASSLPELVGDAAVLVEPGTDAVQTLAAAAIRVLSNPALAHTLQVQGLRQASTFTWASTIHQMLSFYSGSYELSSTKNRRDDRP